jgi:hypothetical protein
MCLEYLTIKTAKIILNFPNICICNIYDLTRVVLSDYTIHKFCVNKS